MSNAKNLATFLQSGGSIAGDANFDSNTLFVDSSANAVCIGTDTARSQGGFNNGALQVEMFGTTSANFIHHSNDTTGAFLLLSKSRGTTAGATTVVQDDDILGAIRFSGADGTDYRPVGAEIQAIVDGTPGNNDMPCRLEFKTTADGSQNATTAMTIDSGQNVGIGTSPSNKLDIKGTVGFEATNSTNAWLAYTYTDNTFRLNYNGAGADEVTITSGGSVGIGTTSPSEKLHIFKATYPILKIESTSYNGTLGIDTGNGNLVLNNVSNAGLQFNTNNTTRMSLSSAGKLSLTQSDEGIQIGPDVAAYTIKRDSGGLLNFNATQGTFNGYIFDTADGERMRIDSSGNLLVGKTSSDLTTTGSEVQDGAMRIVASSTSTNLATNSGASLLLGNPSSTNGNFSNIGSYNTNQLVDSQINFIHESHSSRTGAIGFSTHDGSALTERMRIDSSGKVGIGSTSPNSTLHIANKNSSGSSSTPNFRAYAVDGDSYFEINNSGNNSILQRIYRSDTTLVYTFDAHSGNLTITGALSKGSGSFKIDHPLPAKTDTHDLVHSFVEAPQADNIYRGVVDLVNGSATVNIDTVAGMTDGTFAALNREVQCFTSNESGWTAIKGSVSGNTLTITAQDNTCTDTVSWLVIGERKDQHMYDTDWTDDNGKVIVEPQKLT
jgi:hypothetical protein